MNIDDLYLSTNSNKSEVFVVLYKPAFPKEDDDTSVVAVFNSFKAADKYVKDNSHKLLEMYESYLIENYEVHS